MDARKLDGLRDTCQPCRNAQLASARGSAGPPTPPPGLSPRAVQSPSTFAPGSHVAGLNPLSSPMCQSETSLPVQKPTFSMPFEGFAEDLFLPRQ